jgi:phenylalanyl-tRNA synthetase beta chain
MKISINWLNDYIDTAGLDVQKIAEILSNLGFPNEGIENLADDAVIDLEVTSNRGDCLSYIGVARELSAVTGKPIKLPQIQLVESNNNASSLASVEILEPDLCPRYTARIIENVKIGPSPDWVVKRLNAAGIRSVNNVVDATNYAMLETGQPPHAFDYNKIPNGKIIVRKAKQGEKIVSIDGSKCELGSNMLIIADHQNPVAIAGVMGGLETEVSDTTTAILLEDASFNPVSVRNTSRTLSLPSEAAYRFERIVDIEMIDWASKRTAQLITQFAGGSVAKGVVDAYPRKYSKKDIALRLSRIKHLLGIDVPADAVIKILTSLSFQPKLAGDIVSCTAPTWRNDVYREVDLIEEIARVYGYDKVPTRSKIQIDVVKSDTRQKLQQAVCSALNSCGYYETINVTFVSDAVSDLFAAGEHLAVKDVTRKDANRLRQTLLGSLLDVLKNNLYVKNSPCRVFEIANIFVPAKSQNILPDEKTELAFVCDGDFRQIRGVVEAVIRNVNKNAALEFVPAEIAWAQAGAEIKIDGKVIGQAGLVSDAVKKHYDFKDVTPCAARLNFTLLLDMPKAFDKFNQIPRFPAIIRDLSLIIDESVVWADIVKAINKQATGELENIEFIEIYRGKNIPDGKKSVTLSLRFRDENGTLTHETVDSFEKNILKGLSEELSAVLRTS